MCLHRAGHLCTGGERGGLVITFDLGNVRFNYRIVGAAIANGRVLVHRAETDDYFALPGGRGEPMEQARHTLRREMVEELGVTVRVGRLLWVVESFFGLQQRSFHELGLYFLMSLPRTSPLLGQHRFYGIEGPTRLIFEWHALSELPSLPLYPSFLRKGLQSLPHSTQHVVDTDTQ